MTTGFDSLHTGAYHWVDKGRTANSHFRRFAVRRAVALQFSLKQLLIATSCSGVGCFALIYANFFFASAAFTVVFVLLLSACVLAYTNFGANRAFWIGFLVFGWGYWIVLHSPLFDVDVDSHNWRMHGQGPPLITTDALEWVYYVVLPLVHEEPQLDIYGNRTNATNYPIDTEYMRVGHSLFALLLAYCGAVLARFSWRQQRRSANPQT